MCRFWVTSETFAIIVSHIFSDFVKCHFLCCLSLIRSRSQRSKGRRGSIADQVHRQTHSHTQSPPGALHLLAPGRSTGGTLSRLSQESNPWPYDNCRNMSKKHWHCACDSSSKSKTLDFVWTINTDTKEQVNTNAPRRSDLSEKLFTEKNLWPRLNWRKPMGGWDNTEWCRTPPGQELRGHPSAGCRFACEWRGLSVWHRRNVSSCLRTESSR